MKLEGERKGIFKDSSRREACLAQWEECAPPDLGIMSSNPTWGIEIT